MQSQGELSFTELVLNASFLVQCVMFFLLVLSVVSWTIIISRNNQYRLGRVKADDFEERFWSGVDLNNLYQECMKRPDELVGLEVIYSAGFKEFVRLVNSGPADQDVVMDGTYRQMKVACSREVELLETHLPTLATIGSISPYIGLFGTVWGIMHAFVALSSVKNATLAMVAPPIAEALIATAMGLFAAIPAVMFYNRFVTKVEALENRYYNFMDEFSTILNRRLVTIRTQLNRQAPTPSNQGMSGVTPPSGIPNVQSVGTNSADSSTENQQAHTNENATTQNISNTNQNHSNYNEVPPTIADMGLTDNLPPQNNYSDMSLVKDNNYIVRDVQRTRANVDMNSLQAQAFAQSLNTQRNANQNMGNTSNRRSNANTVANNRRMQMNNMVPLNAANAAMSGMSANTNAQSNPQLNDPRMAANLRGVVPPRNNNVNNNVQLPGGNQNRQGAIEGSFNGNVNNGNVAANNMANNNMANMNNNGNNAANANMQANQGPVYKANTDYERNRANKHEEEPHYITPGVQNNRRNNASNNNVSNSNVNNNNNATNAINTTNSDK